MSGRDGLDMTSGRLIWVSVSSRDGGLFVAKSENEPRLVVTAPTRDGLMSMIPNAIVDLFDRAYGEKVSVFPLETDDPRQAVAVLPNQENVAQHA